MPDDLTPGSWPVTRSAGDADTPTAFNIRVNGEDLTLTAAVAQVRRQRARSSALVLERSCQLDDNIVVVGRGDAIPDTPGTFWWDLEVEGVVDGDEFGPLTIVSGPFRVLPDVTVEVVSQ